MSQRAVVRQDQLQVGISNLQVSVTYPSKCLFLAHEQSSVNVSSQAALPGGPLLRHGSEL